jgi:hypothetical protein
MADILNKLNSANFVTVKVIDNAIVNGNNLLAAYSLAKTINPNGIAKSATNRLAVILPAAIYDLGTQSLVLNTEFIDIIGSTSDRDKHYIKSNVGVANKGVVEQTADNVKLYNLTIHNINTTFSDGSYDQNPDRATVYHPSSNLPLTYLENIKFLGDDTSIFSMRMSITYSGTYVNCTGGDFSFGGAGRGGGGNAGGTLSGTFINCTGGHYSFGGGDEQGGTLSGTFKNCTGGDLSFGGGGGSELGLFDGNNGGHITSTAVLENCTGGNYSFGGGEQRGGTLSGTFKNCTGGDFSFGGCANLDNFDDNSAILTLASKFTNCTGGNYSFGGGPAVGTVLGIFKDCKGGIGSFANL